MWKKTLAQNSSVYLICKLIVQFSFLKVLILSSFLITYFIYIVHLVINGQCIQGNCPQPCTEMTVKLFVLWTKVVVLECTSRCSGRGALVGMHVFGLACVHPITVRLVAWLCRMLSII